MQGLIWRLQPCRRAAKALPRDTSRSSRRACSSNRSTSRSSSRCPAGASLGSPGLRTRSRSRSSSCGSCRPLCQGHRACSNSSSCRGRRPCNSRLGSRSCSSSRLRWRLRSRACRAPCTASSHCLSSSRRSSWATRAACPSRAGKCRAPCSCPLRNHSRKPLGRPGQSPWRHLGSHVSSLVPARSRCSATPIESSLLLPVSLHFRLSWAFRAGDDVTDEVMSLCSQSHSHRLGSSICSDRPGQLLCGRLCRWGLHPRITLSSLVFRWSASPERSRLARLHFLHQDESIVLSADGEPGLLDSRPLAVGLALQAALALSGCPSRQLTCLVIENSLLFAGANHSEAAPW